MKDKDKIAGAMWLMDFQRIQIESAQLINPICPTRGLSVDDDFRKFKETMVLFADDSSGLSKVFLEAEQKLPEILMRMRNYPKSEVRKARKIQDLEVKALNWFIEAFRLGVVWSSDRNNRGLEAAMFMQFTRTWKAWKASDKEADDIFR